MPWKRVTTPSGSRKISAQAPVFTSHTRIASSHPPLARNLPSGLHATPYTIHLWPRSNLGGHKWIRSEEHTSELQSRLHLVCRLLLEKKKGKTCRHVS